MRKLLAVVVLASAVSAYAQDSVSSNLGGLPGDALDQYDPNLVCAEYVVDLVPFQGSWGTDWTIAPLIKSSKGNPDFFNNLISAQGISRLHQVGVPFAASSYDVWMTAGAGVNPTENTAPMSVSPTGSSNQFGVVFADFGFTMGSVPPSYNGVIGGVVNYDPADASRLYVKRVVAASNGFNATEARSSFGVGAVDADGNVMFRFDGFDAFDPNAAFGQNIQWVDLLARDCSSLNVIDGQGASDPNSGNLVFAQAAQDPPYNVPNVGPEQVFGEPFYIGANFNRQYAYAAADGAPGIAFSEAHRAGAPDHRGAIVYHSRFDLATCDFGATRGLAAMIGHSGPADRLLVWGLGDTANVTGAKGYLLPRFVPLVDPTTGVDVNTVVGGDNEFDHYHSQTAFRGGTGQVGLGVDQDGRVLAAGPVYMSGGDTDPFNYIAIVRDGCDTAPEWSVVGYSASTLAPVNGSFLGKPIYNGDPADAGTVEIGRMAPLFAVTGGTPVGPSLSAPAIDSAGNVWFVSAVELTRFKDGSMRPEVDFDSALLRAVYDPATFSYDLELIVELGEVFPGANSARNWQISFIGIADSNSVSSGTFFSQNITETGLFGQRYANLPPAAEEHTGGVILNVDTTYDVNSDGIYNDPSSSNFDPSEPADESYQAVLYIQPFVEATPQCLCGDVNNDGSVNAGDIDCFVQAVVSGTACDADCSLIAADTNGDNAVNSGDIDTFVAAVVNGGCL